MLKLFSKIMEKYSRILVIIFFLTVGNLALSIYTISKLNRPTEQEKQISTVTPKASPTPTSKPAAKEVEDSNSKADLTLIKAEIRALREILGVTGSFEELSALIKGLENKEP